MLLLIPLVFIAMANSVFSQTKNGFSLSNSKIPVAEIMGGGPAKDGIPSIDDPKFSKATKSTLPADARILGVYVNGIAKAYPISIMSCDQSDSVWRS